MKYVIADCTEGDKFLLNVNGAVSGRAWAFLTSNNVLISRSDASVTLTNYYVTAPCNAAKIIINDNFQEGTSGGNAYKITAEAGNGKIVRFDIAQNLTAEQKAQARENIGIEGQTLNEYGGLICSGTYKANDILFDSTKVSAGDTLYYKTHLVSAAEAVGYIGLYNSSDVRIALFGTINGAQGKINELRQGVIVVPSGFSYAKWYGNNGVVEYVTKYMPPDYYNRYYKTNVDLMVTNPSYLNGYKYNPTTKTVANIGGTTGLAQYIPVVPGGKIYFNKSLASKSYGHAFYDANLTLVTQFALVKPASAEFTLEIPANVYYVSLTFLLSTKSDCHAYYEPPALDTPKTPDYMLNPYIRRTIKEYGEFYLSSEFTHVMPGGICNFNGKKILAYRCGYMHDSRTTSSLYGCTQLDSIDEKGRLTHVHQYKPSDFGCSGDGRGALLGVSRDGNYLLMLALSNRGTAQNPTADCAIVCLNKSLSVVDYKKVISDTGRYAFGTPLVTPEGHIIFTAYTQDNKQYVYRSEEVFTGTVSGLTFTSTLVLTTTETSNEACMGYHNNKLYMLIRCETTAGKVMWTDDLEGTTGWSDPISIGIRIHSPELAPYHSGKYLPFFASWYDSATMGQGTRKPAMGYLDVDTENSVATVKGIGILDNTLDTVANNGYPVFTPLGNECYAVVYYQEDATNTYSGEHQQTGLYYRYINAREIIPEAAYFLDSDFVLLPELKAALMACFAHVAWADDDGKNYYNALAETLGTSPIPSDIIYKLQNMFISNGSNSVDTGVSFETDKVYTICLRWIQSSYGANNAVEFLFSNRSQSSSNAYIGLQTELEVGSGNTFRRLFGVGLSWANGKNIHRAGIEYTTVIIVDTQNDKHDFYLYNANDETSVASYTDVSFTHSNVVNSQMISLGYHGVSANPGFKGTILDFIIKDRVLSSDEIIEYLTGVYNRNYLVMEIGDIDSTTGEDTEQSKRIRSDGYIEASGTLKIYGCPFAESWYAYSNNGVNTAALLAVRYYDSSKQLLGTQIMIDSSHNYTEYELPSSARYIRLLIQKDANYTYSAGFSQSAIYPLIINGIPYYFKEV